jgi:hypothetical protein
MRAQDLPPRVPPTSCRAGNIVHMLTSTGHTLPVRLTIKQREDPSGLSHVVQVGAFSCNSSFPILELHA